MGTPAPLLSVYGEDEFRLFDRLVRKHARLDFDAMALEWCDEVNGVTIFPKLPVYLRMHHTVWQRNERARQAVETAAAGEVELARINAETLQQLMPAAAQAAAAGGGSGLVMCSDRQARRRGDAGHRRAPERPQKNNRAQRPGA